MRGKNSKCRHSVYGNRFGYRGSERLGKEGDSTFSLSILWEEPLEPMIRLRNKEWRRPQTASAVGDVDLMVKELLDVVDGEEVLATHRNDDRIPICDTRTYIAEWKVAKTPNCPKNVNLGFILDCIQEEQHEIHRIHDRQSESNLVCAKCITEVLVVARANHHAHRGVNGFPKGEGQEPIRFGELATKYEEPEKNGGQPLFRRHAEGVGSDTVCPPLRRTRPTATSADSRIEGLRS
jgi:hypothetical protein